ncbi:MAG: hypothetical protein ABIS35_13685 [Terracoccus sp.]
MDGDTGGRAPRAVPPALRVPRLHRWDAPVSRRGVVAAATLGAVTVLAGCGLRLDLPPDPAPTPTRRPAPDERYLLSVIADLRDLVVSERRLVASGAAGTVVPTLLPLHERQVAVLVGRLTNDGVPTTAIPTSVPTAGPTGAGAATPAQLATRLAALTPADWTDLAAASAATRELVAAAYGTRLAGAELLGRAVAVPATPSPAGPALVDRTAPLVYAFEVVAAQSTGKTRERALVTLSELRRLLEDVSSVAGATPDLPGGWALPFPVTTPEGAARLATRTLSTAVAAATDAAGQSPTGATLEDVARWSARVQSLATTWGVPLVAFPGTTA